MNDRHTLLLSTNTNTHTTTQHTQVADETMTRNLEGYNLTVTQYNDTEVALGWPGWQQPWPEQETDAPLYGP